MKLRNKKTGEIGNLVLNINPNRESFAVLSTENGDTLCGNLVIGDYDSLAELNEEWEDYEEKGYWYIDSDGDILKENFDDNTEYDNDIKSLGNYFKTREEAEKALEKLKAWKRLRDKGFRCSGFSYTELCDYARINIQATMINDGINDDLDLLFGGEE